MDCMPVFSAPEELRVYENAFHPLGSVAAEIFRSGAEWLERVLAGELSEAGRDVRHHVQRNGTVSDGNADPCWWLGQGPPAIA